MMRPLTRWAFRPLTWAFEKMTGAPWDGQTEEETTFSSRSFVQGDVIEVQAHIKKTAKDDSLVQKRAETLIEKIRAWRQMILSLPKAKLYARLIEEERELRKQMGTELGSEPAAFQVDGKGLIYKPKTILGPEDYEGAWKSLIPTLGEEDRKRATALLQRKSHRISHEFVTE